MAQEVHPVTFSAPDRGSAPLTWGQLNIWRPLQQMPGISHAFNVVRTVVPDTPVRFDSALSAIGRLIERHQALRTRYRAGDDGTPRQVVAARGEYRVEAVDAGGADPDAVAAAQATRLTATRFDVAAGWPARFALVRDAGLVAGVVLVASHVAVDDWAAGLLAGDLRRLLAGEQLAPVTWQPLDQAAYESSPQGAQLERQAFAFWRECLREAAPAPFGDSPRPAGDPLLGDDPPIRRWLLHSPAVAAAAGMLAERTGASTSAVLLTATGAVLAAVTGRDRLAVKVIAGNRVTRQLAGLATVTAQNGVFLARRADQDLLAAIGDGYRLSRRSYFYARYHPDRLAALVAEIEQERRTPLDLSVYFNDATLGQQWPAVTVDGAPEGWGRLRAASRVEELPPLAEHDMKLFVTVYADPAGCRIRLLADTRYVPVPTCQRVLRGLETVLCEAVHRTVRVDQLDQLLSGDSAIATNRSRQ